MDHTLHALPCRGLDDNCPGVWCPDCDPESFGPPTMLVAVWMPTPASSVPSTPAPSTPRSVPICGIPDTITGIPCQEPRKTPEHALKDDASIICTGCGMSQDAVFDMESSMLQREKWTLRNAKDTSLSSRSIAKHIRKRNPLLSTSHRGRKHRSPIVTRNVAKRSQAKPLVMTRASYKASQSKLWTYETSYDGDDESPHAQQYHTGVRWFLQRCQAGRWNPELTNQLIQTSTGMWNALYKSKKFIPNFTNCEAYLAVFLYLSHIQCGIPILEHEFLRHYELNGRGQTLAGTSAPNQPSNRTVLLPWNDEDQHAVHMLPDLERIATQLPDKTHVLAHWAATAKLCQAHLRESPFRLSAATVSILRRRFLLRWVKRVRPDIGPWCIQLLTKHEPTDGTTTGHGVSRRPRITNNVQACKYFNRTWTLPPMAAVALHAKIHRWEWDAYRTSLTYVQVPYIAVKQTVNHWSRLQGPKQRTR